MIRSIVITISASAVAGTREDLSGPALEAKINQLGCTVTNHLILADEEERIANTLRELADTNQLDVIVTTGGTGHGPRDVTTEATARIADREIPGFGELMRAEGLKSTRFAPLSRGGAWSRGNTLILNLPGSPKGAVESFVAVAYLVSHVVDLLHGKTEHSQVAQK